MTSPEPGPSRLGRTTNIPNTKKAKMTYPLTQQFLAERNGQFLRPEWGPRCVALLVDFLGFSIPFNFLGQLIWLQRAIGKSVSEGSSETATVIGIPPELHNVLWFLLFGLFATLTTRRWGATPGKRWLNLEVVKADESGPPTFLTLYGRYTIGYFLSAVLGLGGFIIAIFDKNKETLHDKIFKTSVVLADPTRLDSWY